MTAKETKDVIEKYIKCANSPCPNDDSSCEGCELFITSDEWDKALKTAIEALGMPRASDLISRKMAIIQLSHNKTGDDDCDVVIQRDIETIKSLPSMRSERKPGKWISEDHGLSGHCSECGFETVNYEHGVFGYDYCPNCGERLEIEEE